MNYSYFAHTSSLLATIDEVIFNNKLFALILTTKTEIAGRTSFGPSFLNSEDITKVETSLNP